MKLKAFAFLSILGAALLLWLGSKPKSQPQHEPKTVELSASKLQSPVLDMLTSEPQPIVMPNTSIGHSSLGLSSEFAGIGIQEYYDQATQLAEQGHWTEVERIGKQLLDKFPEDKKGYLVSAMAVLEQGRPALEALDIYLEGVTKFPNDRDLSNLAWELLSQDQLPAGYAGFDDLDGAEAEQLRFVAKKKASQGDFSNAIRAKLMYIEIEPDRLYKEYEDLASYHLQLGQLQEALSALRAARDFRQLYPDDILEEDRDRGAFEQMYFELLIALNYADEALEYAEMVKMDPELLPDQFREQYVLRQKQI